MAKRKGELQSRTQVGLALNATQIQSIEFSDLSEEQLRWILKELLGDAEASQVVEALDLAPQFKKQFVALGERKAPTEVLADAPPWD